MDESGELLRRAPAPELFRSKPWAVGESLFVASGRFSLRWFCAQSFEHAVIRARQKLGVFKQLGQQRSTTKEL